MILIKKMQTVEEQLKKYKKRFYVLLAVSALITALFGFYIFLNYDYLAFKHFITGHYIYTDALDKLFKKELNRDVKGNYYSYFDDLVIAAVTKQIRETNNDRYTYLYIPEQYRKYLQEEKDEARQSETKIIILQNQNTASASENFVAALKNNLRNALLIGGKTYGKGIGQFTLPLIIITTFASHPQ